MNASAVKGGALVVEGVSMSFGGTQALSNASLIASAGSVVGLIGPNGAGKTTLLNVISGVYRPHEGKVFVEGEEVTGKVPYKVARRGLARTFQSMALFPHESVFDNVMFGRHRLMRANLVEHAIYLGRAGREERKHRDDVERALELVGISSFRNTLVGALSWGQQRLVEIARALAAEPRVLLLDEPTSGMNQTEKDEVADVISQVQHELGIAQVLIEHDVAFIASLCQSVVALDFGRVVASGPPEEVLTSQAVVEAYVGTGSHGGVEPNVGLPNEFKGVGK